MTTEEAIEWLAKKCSCKSDDCVYSSAARDLAELADTRRQLARWQDLYGCEKPSDSVVGGNVVGKIVAERNREIHELKRQLAELRELHHDLDVENGRVPATEGGTQ